MVSERQSKEFPLNYHRNGAGLYIQRWVGSGAARTAVYLALPAPEIISQEFA